MFDYNPKYFDGESLIDTRHYSKSFRIFRMEDGIILGMFQGSRGDRPDIDFILKFLEPGRKKRLRTPENMHWVVDLLLKRETHKDEIKNIIKYFHDFYQEAPQLTTVNQRNTYSVKSPAIIKLKYKDLNHSGTYSIEYISYLLELFTLCEKVTPRKKKMFEGLLKKLVDYCDGSKDFYQIMSATKPGFRK